MQILKTFVDGSGKRHKVGADAPKEWDKATLAHYLRHGMVGEPPRARRASKPTSTKPAGPEEIQSAAPQEAPADH